MDSDITQTQPGEATANPQAADKNIGASDSNSFQQSAGVDDLKQYREVQVVPTGNKISSNTSGPKITGATILFVVIASIVLIMIASSVFRWIMKRPDSDKKSTPKADDIKAAQAKPEVEDAGKKTDEVLPKKLKYEVVRPLATNKSKKKLPRSKRNKQ